MLAISYLRPSLAPLLPYLLLVSVTLADYPTHGITVELGPANDDVGQLLNRQIKQQLSQGRSHFDGIGHDWQIDLSDRDLREAKIHLELEAVHSAIFDRANFTGADLSETFFENCSFRGAILRRVTLNGSPLRGCDLTDADISGSEIALDADQLVSTKSYKKKDLSDMVLTGNFQGVSFAGFNLQNTDFRCWDFRGCDFSDANIRGCDFGYLPLQLDAPDQFFTRKRLLTKEQIYSTASYQERDMDRVSFTGCDLRSFDFSGQCLGRFVQCDLRDVNLSNALFLGADGKDRRYLSNRQTYRYGFFACNLNKSQFYEMRNFQIRSLPIGCMMKHMDFESWSFEGHNLRGVDFLGSSMTNANLSGAEGGYLEYAKGLTVPQVKSMLNYTESKLDQDGFTIPDDIMKELGRKR